MAARKQGFMRDRQPNTHKQSQQSDLSRSADRQRPRAPAPTSLPDEVWDVFRLDDADAEDEPEPGDFWWEPDDREGLL
jgi:hypothetical protein